MPRFSDMFIQQVAQAIDIVDLVSQYVALKKRGAEFVGLCPFHEDHSPSMYVSPAKQIFKCFVCGAGGGVFQFLTLYEKIPFPEAVRTLAERANIPLPKESQQAPDAPQGLSKNDLLGVTTFAARYFRSQLQAPAGSAALQYALGRGLTQASIDRFGLGYSVESWDALLQTARRQGIGESQLLAAGLIIRREGSSGCYDRFRNRLMFPIIDPLGGVIAFGGRALDAAERAKYLNSPETPLFDKSNQLYALNWARETIVSSGQAVVVEGYLDALIPHQAGVGNVVATLGTALTDRHVRLLSRYAREIVLIYDADAAGQAASERALEVFLTQQLHVRIATIPEGKDPCDYCLAQGGEALRQLIADAPDALAYIWHRRQQAWQAAGNRLAERRRLVEDFLRLVASSAVYGSIDEVRRGQLAQHIGHMLNISPGDLQVTMRRLARKVPPPRPGGPSAGQAPSPAAVPPRRQPSGAEGGRAELNLLEVLLNRPDLFGTVSEKILPDDFEDEQLRTLAACLWQAGHDERLRLEELLAREDLAELGGLLTDLATAGEKRGNYEQTLAGAVEQMLHRRGREELRELKSGGLDDEETLRQIHQRLAKPDVRRRPRIQ